MVVKIVALPLRRTVMITPMKIDEMVVYRHHNASSSIKIITCRNPFIHILEQGVSSMESLQQHNHNVMYAPYRAFWTVTSKHKDPLPLPNKVLSSACSYFKSP